MDTVDARPDPTSGWRPVSDEVQVGGGSGPTVRRDAAGRPAAPVTQRGGPEPGAGGAGAHPAMVGAFTVLRFQDAELPDVVYLEHLTNAVYLDKREEVEHYIYVMENVCVRSASPDQTVGILHRIMEQYEGG